MEKEKTIGLLHSNYVYYGVGLVLMCTVALFSKQLPTALLWGYVIKSG